MILKTLKQERDDFLAAKEESVSLGQYCKEFFALTLEEMINNKMPVLKLKRSSEFFNNIAYLCVHSNIPGDALNKAYPIHELCNNMAEMYALTDTLCQHLLEINNNQQALSVPDEAIRKFARIKKREPHIVYQLYNHLLNSLNSKVKTMGDINSVEIKKTISTDKVEKFNLKFSNSDIYIECNLPNASKKNVNIKSIQIGVEFKDITEHYKKTPAQCEKQSFCIRYRDSESVYMMHFRFHIIDSENISYALDTCGKDTEKGREILSNLYDYAKNYYEIIYTKKEDISHKLLTTHVRDINNEITNAIKVYEKKKGK